MKLSMIENPVPSNDAMSDELKEAGAAHSLCCEGKITCEGAFLHLFAQEYRLEAIMGVINAVVRGEEAVWCCVDMRPKCLSPSDQSLCCFEMICISYK